MPYVKASDVFLTMSEGLITEFKKYNPHVFWLTQAFEHSCFETGPITKEDIAYYSSDIAFVGNLGSKDQYLSRRGYLDNVLNSGLNLKWWGPRIPRKFSTIPLMLGKLGKAYGGKFVWGAEYAKVAGLSKIFLAFDSKPHIRKSMSARMYTAVGCGAFYMCEHVDGIEDVLEPGKEIVTFRAEMTAPISLRRTDSQRIGLSTSICKIRQAIAGFQRIASRMPRAAEGVITS